MTPTIFQLVGLQVSDTPIPRDTSIPELHSLIVIEETETDLEL